jgi:CO/xanthine dehydrogenase Mo-binding subunit
MTGLLHEKSFSRTAFVKGGGALVVGFSTAAALAGRASAYTSAPNSPPVSAAGYLPNANAVDSWIAINADNTVTLKTSQIEVGNGITTGFLQVLAEELNTNMSQMHYGNYNANSLDVVDTYVAISSGGEGGSNAMSGTGPKVRAAGAVAYNALLNMAASKLNVPVSALSVKGGVISGGGSQISYGQLVGGQLLNLTVNPSSLNPGQAPAKPIANYTTVTIPNTVQRIDIPEKVTGEYTYVQNVRVPGMLHGRIVRPRGQGPYPYNSDVPVSVDASSIASIAGAKVVQVGNFLGVVAPQEYDAIQAAAQLNVVWNQNKILPGVGNLWSHYRQLDASGLIPAAISSNVGNINQGLANAAHVVSGTFKYHYQGHMPIGPSCALADVTSSGATIYSNTQNVEGLVTDLVNVLYPLQASQIRVLFYEGAGSFGNGCVAFDTAESAAAMSKAVGAPVRLQFMRWDEHGWTHYAPAIMSDMTGGADANGNIVAYQATQFSQGGTSLYTGRELVGSNGAPNATVNALPTTVNGSGINTENTSPWMKVANGSFPNANYQLISKPVNSPYGMFQSGPLRAPGAPQTVFADAQLVDMLAVASNMDSLAFRLQNMQPDSTNQRWSNVLNAAAQAAGWTAWVSGSKVSEKTGTIVHGRGIANGHHGGSYAAVVADILVNKKTGKINVTHLYGAQDAGLTVNPNLVENQIVGNLVQSCSRAMWEELQFNQYHVTSVDWVTYPILRFVDAPNVTAVVVQRTDQPCLGSGEPCTCPTVGAIANAFYDAVGTRMHEAPLTPGRVRATLRAAGIS